MIIISYPLKHVHCDANLSGTLGNILQKKTMVCSRRVSVQSVFMTSMKSSEERNPCRGPTSNTVVRIGKSGLSSFGRPLRSILLRRVTECLSLIQGTGRGISYSGVTCYISSLFFAA